jgi:hypothetical protein
MNGDPDKPKRWRPRWSVRTLVLVVTLVCAYLACWGPTKSYGIRDVGAGRASEAIAPLIIAAPMWGEVFADGSVYGGRCYYLWFFGYVRKLPFDQHSGYELNIPAG